MAERRLMRDATTASPQPRLELRLRTGVDARQPEPAHPNADRRTQPNLSRAGCGPGHQQRRRDQGLERGHVPARPPGEHPLRQWPGDDLAGVAHVGHQSWLADSLHRARITVGERVLRELQRQTS